MKTKSKFFTVSTALCALLLFSMCDKVNQPLQNAVPGGGVGSGAIVDSVVGSTQRNILIEDYTGHQCGNCPKANDTLEAIKALYPAKLVSVAIHSGYYSAITPAPYTYNFVVADPLTPGYNEIDNFFQISANGNPNGMINRLDYNLSTQMHIKGIDQWKAQAALVAAQASKVQLSVKTSTDTISDAIECTIKVKFLQGLSGDYKVATMIIEDSVIKPQKDYRFNPDEIPNFVHRHVLRGYVYGAFGEQIGTNNPAANSEDSKTHTVAIPSNIIDIKHCGIIAYVYDAVTYEVLQVEEIHLIHH